MRLPFVKMEGAGNDYVYFDAIANDVPLERLARLAPRIADRRFGVGGDGVIVVGRSDSADCRMTMWNADGSRGAMCGNGLRCVAWLADQAGHARGERIVIDTDSGPRTARILARRGDTARVAVDFGAVTMDATPQRATIAGRTWHYHPGDAGNPHAVVFVDEDPEHVPVAAVGAAMQSLAAFPGGVNVEFVQVVADGNLVQRTFERGSGETLACGSGAAAAVAAALATGRASGPRVAVRLRGGELIFVREGSSLVMEGPARTVFRGEIALADFEPPAR
jgi:diaminopimelate epimerase